MYVMNFYVVPKWKVCKERKKNQLVTLVLLIAPLPLKSCDSQHLFACLSVNTILEKVWLDLKKIFS